MTSSRVQKDMDSNEVANLLKPDRPVRVALIGAGHRSRTIYRPITESLTPWITIVAVCDPVRPHADALADALNVPAYYDIRRLVADSIVEAAIVVTPIESHHSISVFLSSHAIHNLVETSWCSMLSQAREMISTAKKNSTIIRVAENFFRFPVDRFAKIVRSSGCIGNIGRVFCYNDHTGYHNNSRWIAFAEQHPVSVQCVRHTMATKTFRHTPQRVYDSEAFEARFFVFPGDLLIADQAANIKGFLGRHPRPGYTEWQGAAGTFVSRGSDGMATSMELRVCSLDDSPWVDVLLPVINECKGGQWARTYCEHPGCRLEYVNQLRTTEIVEHERSDYYGICVMELVADFALAVRGLRASEYGEQDALMSLMMEIGARESAVQQGALITLPLVDDLETDRTVRESLHRAFGVDPLDVDAMLSVSFPRP